MPDGTLHGRNRALLLLLVSYLLLWENVTSVPTCVKRDRNTRKSLRRLFALATFISQITSRQAANLFAEFDKQYAQGKRYNDRIPDICPSDFLDTPGNKNQVLESKIGEKHDESYPVWSGLSSLKSSNEDVRCFAFYNMIRCLLRDSRRVTTFLEVLKYQIIQNKC
ncbi:hypothetical protein ACRRTK_018263 [Alexandromys fortis]